MYLQLYVFTFLTSVMFETFCFIECALPQKSLTQHFYRLGERESKRPQVRKHIPSHAETAKREAFFFFTVLDHLPTTHEHRNTVTHQQSHSSLSLNS